MDFIKKMKLKHFFSLIAQMQNHQHISKNFVLGTDSHFVR